ncbi:MAG: formylglycine-generating enzyme family protein [Proteobacteria bacterium]|nr:formylglycine-generating enzyme family protein [Pseudomonadota bacterium]MCP4918994.1 formylglycine-generating enzyme family protein [Pseudomonadota bacterium]
MDLFTLIPAGPLVLGIPLSEEPPVEHAIAAYKLSKSHMTVEQFQASAPPETDPAAWRTVTDDPRCNLGSERADHPANCVNWYHAKAWCEHNDMRLPTEAEWEHAARAGTTSRYWWGGEFDANRLNSCASETCEATIPAVTEGPRCNAWGVCDASGQLWEWTLTTWDASPHATEIDPAATVGLMRGGSMVAKGGDAVLDVAYRSDLNLASSNFYMGFRCVAEAP